MGLTLFGSQLTPALGIQTTVAVFQDWGKTPVPSERFKIAVYISRVVDSANLRSFAGTSLNP